MLQKKARKKKRPVLLLIFSTAIVLIYSCSYKKECSLNFSPSVTLPLNCLTDEFCLTF